MSGLGVDKIMRRAGHDTVQTMMGYVKLAEDLNLGSSDQRLNASFAKLHERSRCSTIA